MPPSFIFPRPISYTYWNSPWYPAKAGDHRHWVPDPAVSVPADEAYGSLDSRRERLLTSTPTNDVFLVNPGTIVKCRPADLIPRKDHKRLRGVEQEIGRGAVKLVQYRSGDWQLMVDEKPYVIRAVAYEPTKIGQSPDEGTLVDWSMADYNKDGVIDAAYDRLGRQEPQ